jgi:4-hydroxy-2-oxoheptanedioate aldolase
LISEIVTVPGLDLLFIGLGDLATSIGLKGQTDHPDVVAAISTLQAAIRKVP